MIPLIVSLPVEITSKTICVRPTDQPYNQCDCHFQLQTDCHTLDEWIRMDRFSKLQLNPFTSNTTVILLAGVHLINSTKNHLVIIDVHSLVLTGDKSNTSITTVTCIQDFSITFVDSNHVSLSTITLNSCALRFLNINNTQLINLSVINSRLVITQFLRKRDVELGYHGTVDDKKQCKFRDNFDIIDSTFHNCHVDVNVYGRVLNSPLYTSCYQINLRGVLFKEMERLNSISITKAYNVILTNMTIYNCSFGPGIIPVVIFSVHRLVLQNVKVINTSQSTALLSLREIYTINFAGDVIFKYNRGAHGIVLRHVKNVWTASNSMLRIEKNIIYRYNLFLFEGDTESYSKVYIRSIFEDNYVEGAVMRLDGIYLLAYNSTFIFRRNKSLQTDLENINSTSTSITNAVLLLYNTNCSFSMHSSLNFSHNTAIYSGGITLFNSTIQFMTTTMVYFEYNEGGDGGGMAFYQKSYIIRQQYYKNEWHNETIDLYFYHNKARASGGAIFVKDTDYNMRQIFQIIIDKPIVTPKYFVSIPIAETYSPKIHLHFGHNTAKVSGNDLYGGRIDSCQIRDFFRLSWFPPSSNDIYHAIASDPIRICICEGVFPMCNQTYYHVKAFPGQTFQIEVVAVGQRMGIVPAVVTTELSDGEGRLGEGQAVQGAGRECTALKFTILSSINNLKVLNLRVRDTDFHSLYILYQLLEGSKYQFLTQQFSVSVELQKCPLGFLFNSDSKTCLCLQSINLHSGVQCDYSTYKISKTKHKWISATYEHNDTHHHGVIIYDQCPYDYCQTQNPLSFHLEFPDDQCAFNRSGVLCGACQTNFSHVLGTSRCLKCSNLPLFAVIPGVLFAGVILVIFLILFNLTVSIGTINGLIFYANIIRASQAVFFPPESTLHSLACSLHG